MHKGTGCPEMWLLMPIPGDFQGEVGSAPGQPDRAVVSLFTAGSRTRWPLKVLPTVRILSFYNSCVCSRCMKIKLSNTEKYAAPYLGQNIFHVT